MDVLTPEQRSRCMAAVRARNTSPELILRSVLHRLGHRYRLHDASLPGKPDLVFRQRRVALFVHGCFWHRHDCKAGRSLPMARRAFWLDKLNGNAERDARQARALRRMGWRTIVVWECQLTRKKLDGTVALVEKRLRGSGLDRKPQLQRR